MGFSGIITNAYLLKKHRSAIDDIHSALNFNKVIMTDSGAYQILQYGGVEVSNREIVEYQCNIKSDIGVILDIPTRYDVDRDEAYRSVEETYMHAIEASDIVQKCRDTIWVLPIQGGVHLDILRASAERAVDIASYGYSIYALGSPTTLLEQYMFEKIMEMVYVVRSTIPSSYPLHLFGAGHPLIIPFAVALGVDLMDSASYILYAKDLRYMTRRATYRIDELSYFPCECPVCSKYTVEEFRELSLKDKVRMLALHNLYVIAREIRETKQAIKEGRLWEYLEERAHSHPSAKRAFDVVKKIALEYIYRKTPINRSNIKAVFILSEDSLYNPKIVLPRRRISRNMPRAVKCIALIPYRVDDMPKCLSNLNGLIEKYLESDCDIYAYTPIVGLVPYHLISRYPFSQIKIGVEFSPSIIDDLAYYTLELLLKYISKSGSDISIDVYTCRENTWTKIYASKVVQLLSYSGYRYSVKVVELCQ